ncbi:MAG: hypothetical protein SWK76_04350 [Actinomycetota bacterium]|nr:hypothetical protein [Actinomycetota bacterium]
MVGWTKVRKVMEGAAALLIVFLLALFLASCGGGEVSGESGESTKLPPAISKESLEETTGSGDIVPTGDDDEDGKEARGDTAYEETTQPGAFAELSGALFTVVSVTRQDSNEMVTVSGIREVAGDYLEVELAIENVGDELVDLSQYSFRIWSPGIDADVYRDYYGQLGYLGAYVSDNMISATLFQYDSLQPVDYKLKIAEKDEGTFLFFDLNPLSTARNGEVTIEGTNLVIHKLRGDDAGEEVEINLAGQAH